MTIATTIAASGPYLPNGVTVAFPFGFDVSGISEVAVVLLGEDGTTTTLSTALYTVTLAPGDDPGGTVTFAAAPAAGGGELWVVLNPDFRQQISFQDEGPFNQSLLNPGLDQAASRAIWLRDQVQRSVRVPFGRAGLVIDPNGGELIGLDENGDLGQFSREVLRGPSGGSVESVGLWDSIATISVPAGTDRISTSGFAVVGKGAGVYVSDASATAGLAAAHPRLCRSDANGRYWRLLPINGAISVEQAGAVGDPARTYAVNDQPQIQAAISYANAMGIPQVLFTQEEYTVWATARVSHPFTGAAKYFPDGNPIVTTEFVTLAGCARQRSRINYRNINGQTFNGAVAGTNWQVVSGELWRGHGIFVVGKAVDPGEGKRPGVRLERLDLQGGLPLDPGNTSWPANAVTGAGWDTSHKTVFVEPDKYTGDVEIFDCKASGWRGEGVYSSNYQGSGLLVRGLIMDNIQGQPINPAGGWVDVRGVYAATINLPFEGWGGSPGYLQGAFYDIRSSSGSIQGGVYNTSGSGSYYKPQIPTVGPFAGKHPVLVLDIILESQFNNVAIGSFLRGRIVAIDTYLQVSANEISGTFREGVQDTDLEIIAIADKGNPAVALSLSGGTAAGTKAITRCRYRGRLERTKRAEAAGYVHVDGIVFLAGTSYGTEVVIEDWSGQVQRGNGASGGSAACLDNTPCFRNMRIQRTTLNVAVSGQNVSTSATLVPRGDWMGLYGTNNTTADIVLPTSGIQDGHEIELENVNGGSSGFCFTVGVAGGSGWGGPKRIVGFKDAEKRIKVRFSKLQNAWIEVEGMSQPITGSAAIDVASIPAGSISAVQSVTVTGARAGMVATITPSADLGDNFGIVDVRADTNVVKFRVQNRDGAAAQDPANVTYRATAQYGY